MKRFIPFAVFLMAILPSPAAEGDLSQLKKDLNIFTKILKASFESEDERRQRDRSDLYPNKIDGTYLQGQGVVLAIQIRADFEMAFFGSDRTLGYADSFDPRYRFQLRLPELGDNLKPGQKAELMERLSRSDELRAMVNRGNDITDDLLDVLRLNRGVLSGKKPYFSKELADEIHALREKQYIAVKEAWEKALETNKALLKNKLTDEEYQKLTQQFQTYQDRLKKLKDDFSARAEDVRRKQQDEWSQKLGSFENQLFDVICQYAASIRDLPDDQHLSVILMKADFTEDEPRDRIYVFQKADLIACRDGRLTIDTLKTKSRAYAF